MDLKFMKGNEAVAEAAVLAGCRFFSGYPITPQNEIPEYMSWRLPQVGGVFVQGESEIASVNMVYGAASVGVRAMTSSSGLGISLKSEGISYLAGARLPALIVNVMRSGPGISTIQPAQQDYFQMTRGLGNGGHELKVYAPSTIQEIVDLTFKAFDDADRDRMPVVVTIDGAMGAMMEPVHLPEFRTNLPDNSSWSVGGNSAHETRSIRSFASLEPKIQEQAILDSCEIYKRWHEEEQEYENYLADDAEYIVVAYGVTARIAKAAVNQMREEGYKVGLIRPITLNPYPAKAFEMLDRNQVKVILDVEMSLPGQMIYDVKLAVKNQIPVEFFGHAGGVIITDEEIYNILKKLV